MAKWADYLISAVSYCSEYIHITKITAHEDTGYSLEKGEQYTRQDIVSKINNGRTFRTIYKNNEGNWIKGQEVFVTDINGASYIKTVDSSIEKDKLEYLSGS